MCPEGPESRISFPIVANPPGPSLLVYALPYRTGAIRVYPLVSTVQLPLSAATLILYSPALGMRTALDPCVLPTVLAIRSSCLPSGSSRVSEKWPGADCSSLYW